MTDSDPVSAAAEQHAVIELRGVSKHYGTGSGQLVAAADDVSFAIGPGGLIALSGASGSGKSTVLHLIGAIERPDSGTIVNDGTEVTALRGAALAAYRRSVGFVFQRYNLLPALTALDNVIAPVLPYRTGWDKAARGRQLLEAVGLGGRERWRERYGSQVVASRESIVWVSLVSVKSAPSGILRTTLPLASIT